MTLDYDDSLQDELLYNTFIDMIKKCPNCDYILDPRVINISDITQYIEPNNYETKKYLVTYHCKHCNTIFHAIFDYAPLDGFYNLLRIYPKSFAKTNFDSRLNELISSGFCMIYNQALIADNNGLTEITGIAFRKAFEVLVKDYAAYLNKNIDKQEILKLSLKQTIDKYFEKSEFEPIFRKISWLGNDHSHTFNKHDEYNVQDLKRFINACVSKIISQLDLEELNNIESKNN